MTKAGRPYSKLSTSFWTLLVLHLLMPIVVVFQFRVFALWGLGAVFFALAIQFFLNRPSRMRKLIAAGLSAILALASASLYTSLLFQGSGFNQQFFLHYSLESLKIGFGQFLPLVIINAVYMVLCAIAAYKLRPVNWQRPSSLWGGIVASLAAMMTLAPITSLIEYTVTKNEKIELNVKSVIRNRAPVKVLPVEKPLKNIVLIYAEGLEATYLDEDIFPGLTPRLTALRSKAVNFTNAHQVMNTKWTMAGIVASQCSIPFNVGQIYGEANVGLASVDKPFSQELCLGDVLKAYGYDNTFMGGAGLDFAGKGKFLKTHGYHHRLGREALSRRQERKGYVTGWGLYDDELIQFLSEEIASKDSQSPYMITALTLDTHQPDGHPSASCLPFLDNDNSMLQSIYCSDQILGAFIESQLETEAAKDTIYVLFSDHLSNRNAVYDTLKAHSDERRLLLMAWGGGLEPQVIDAPITHFDVAPTIFDWAGIPNYHNHNWGRSVATGRSGIWYAGSEANRQAADEVSYIYDDDGFDDITITLDPIEISIGENIYKASYAGDVLKHRIYVVLFDEGGDVESIGFYGSKKYLDQAKVDNWFIAVSGTPAVGHYSEAEAAAHPEGALYYAMGRNGGDDFVTGFIENEFTLPAEELAEHISRTRPADLAVKTE